MFDKYIENHKKEMIENLQSLIKIPSVYENSDNPKKPFGENINNALEFMLNLGEKLGFRTKNIDGYCGYIEFGEGDKLLGIIGHLDVVPSGDNWTYPPFNASLFDNKIYGRGAIDDKGPVIASLYAMKAVMENCVVDKRVRLILGLNEENDWKCIEYYKKHEEIPSIGFSPDADFPCIYAEKSILTSYFEMNYSNCNKDKIIIKNIDCNKNPINVVPKICSTILKINTDFIKLDEFINKLKSIINKYNFEIDIYQLNYEEIKITSHGIGAHAAHPDLGINAISQLIVLLNSIFKYYDIDNSLFDFFDKYINTQFDGKNLEINYKDESGILTLNVGNLSLENNILKFGINLRIPISISISDIENKIMLFVKSYSDLRYTRTDYKNSLYIPKNDPLVKTLCDIFNELNNSYLPPIAIGGATYARAFDNCVSFGSNMPGAKDMCHQTDEFISVDNLVFACKAYAKAIYLL